MQAAFLRGAIESGFNFSSDQRINIEAIPVLDPEPKSDACRPHELDTLERKCLKLVADGHLTDETAAIIGITSREVELLLYSARRKLGATNRMQAVARYLADEMTGSIGV